MRTAGASQLAKLNGIERGAEELMERPHYHMHEGKPVLDPSTGEPLRDESPYCGDGRLLRGMDAQLGVLKLRANPRLRRPAEAPPGGRDGNMIDITRLVPLLGLLGITDEDDDD